MKPETMRFTATLPVAYVEYLKEMTKKKMIPSVNYAVNEALREYLKNQKAAQYESLMHEAGRDEAFLARSIGCFEDFRIIDSEVAGEW